MVSHQQLREAVLKFRTSYESSDWTNVAKDHRSNYEAVEKMLIVYDLDEEERDHFFDLACGSATTVPLGGEVHKLAEACGLITDSEATMLVELIWSPK